ncbi:MAG: TIGR04084 family radical SAM/SPASM domain-containing protein [Candidatus Bathyarchaeia archaeon]
MHYYVTLTTKCNLQCRYCYGEAYEDFDTDFGNIEIDYSLPTSISYDVADLRKFCEKDKETVLVFYGGEPLLKIDKLMEIMDNVKAKHYMLQTNGLLLDRLEPKYANRMHTILVSIDGDERLTDFYRGKGVYRKIVENVKLLRKNGFKGEIIARMTVMEETDIEKQVQWLLFNKECAFSSVHWQINALFWQNDFKRRHFAQWTSQKYNPQVRKLVKTWVRHMETHGKVLKIYPFIGVMESLLKNESSLLRCGAGWTMFNIQTDGNITPCPVMAGMKNYYLGNICETHPMKLKNSVFVGHPCTECKIYAICGGRCLYANVTKRWGMEGFRLVCKTVENLVNCLREAKPKVERLMREGKIRLEDFEYTKYNSSEIIP